MFHNKSESQPPIANNHPKTRQRCSSSTGSESNNKANHPLSNMKDGDQGDERDFEPKRKLGDKFDQEDQFSRNEPAGNGNAQKERKKLQLAPRTKPIEPVPPQAEVVAKSSIFGGAKPVDTAAREREIEERLNREKDTGPKGLKERVEGGRVRKFSSTSSGVNDRSRRSSDFGSSSSLHNDEDSVPQYSQPIPNKDVGRKPSVLKFITWNIAGLDEQDLKPRTEAVCRTILDAQADIVFLQEVIPESVEYILNQLTDYDSSFGGKHGYFVGTLWKKTSITLSDSEIIDFSNSRFGRNALKVDVTFREHPISFLNSHLESMKTMTNERKKQSKLMWAKMLSTSENTTVIFGGDLNIRNREIIELGGLPWRVKDIWEACGSHKVSEYTFDLLLNDNLPFRPGSFIPRLRFDRVYVRDSTPHKLKPTYFGLIGMERLQPFERFPSDHWGILSHFELE